MIQCNGLWLVQSCFTGDRKWIRHRKLQSHVQQSVCASVQSLRTFNVVRQPKPGPINGGPLVIMWYCLVYYSRVSAKTGTTESWLPASIHSALHALCCCCCCLAKTHWIYESFSSCSPKSNNSTSCHKTLRASESGTIYSLCFDSLRWLLYGCGDWFKHLDKKEQEDRYKIFEASKEDIKLPATSLRTYTVLHLESNRLRK